MDNLGSMTWLLWFWYPLEMRWEGWKGLLGKGKKVCKHMDNSGLVWGTGVSVLLECSWMTFSPEVDKQGYVVFSMFMRWIYSILGSAIYSSYCLRDFIAWIYQNVFIHSLVNGHLGYFHVLASVNKANINILVKIFGKHMDSFLLDIYLRVELLGPMVTLCLSF